MLNKKYTVAIEVSKSPQFVFDHIVDLSKWWVEDFTGGKLHLDSVFALTGGEGHHSTNRVIEFVPGKKFTWITTGSLREADNFDWTGTKMIFELTPLGDGTLIRFTYDGVVLEKDKDKLEEICDYCMKVLLYNYLESFSTVITVEKPAEAVFQSLTKVTSWWSKDFEGSSSKLGDAFIIHHPGQHYSRQQLVEVVPNKRMVWLVTDSTLDWLQGNKHEWTGTRMTFDIKEDADLITLHFTHEGLTPNKECFLMCEQGWTMIIKDWLFHFIMHGAESFEIHNAAHIREQMLSEKAKSK